MTVTREQLRALVDRVPEEQLDSAAAALSALSDDAPSRRRPGSLGLVEGEPNDSEQVDKLLADGFGR
ncbi:hypothetical protein QSJ19_09400 [Gordonia sp. ABSL11-1]|uniref:hypothetical protein n=1 Tax=Gordonia sp. ABSL11-1 TaxID=3053924 RepID=UPI002573CE02|nr:hypothetical protein [Gordonia sp. ABSL11-1]MDL9945800.1 hypothetical protein [Gordonia sp. ABSL11-1]